MRTALLVLAVLAASAADSAEPGRLDVLDYDVSVRLDLAAGMVHGKETVRFAARGGTLDTLVLDAAGITVSPITTMEHALGHVTENDVLRVSLGPPVRDGEESELTFGYEARPERALRLSPDAAYTVFNTWRWMPARTDPSDRASVSLRVTLPADFLMSGPGTLVERREVDRGEVMWHWRLDAAVPSYVIGFAAGRLQSLETRAGPVTLRALAPADPVLPLGFALRETADMLRFLQDKAGVPFPSPTYTQVFLPGAPAQEMADMALLGTEHLRDLVEDPKEDWSLVHELAHQWWGNLLTCRDWGHFWLNEGFAQFLTAAWKEERHGRAAYDREMDLARRRLEKARKEGRNRPLVLRNWKTPEESGGTIPYARGALFLDALRRELGDVAFWAGLGDYTRKGASAGSVDSQDLQDALERASGRSLDALFTRWLDGEAPEA